MPSAEDPFAMQLREIGPPQERAPGLSMPTERERAWVRSMLSGISTGPQGLFRYRSHVEADAARQAWEQDAVQQRRRGSRLRSVRSPAAS